jgi:hypothetical protein
MFRRVLIVLWLLASAVAFAASKPAKAAPVDLSGTWKLDALKSTFKTGGRAANKVVITQGDQEIQFDYYAGEKSLGSDVFNLNGTERSRSATRIERTYSRVSFAKNKKELVITTRGVLDIEGTQQYTDTETWTLSPDGKTLTNNTRDGNLFVFLKDTSTAQQTQ